jgi:hypothetical protein
MQCLKLALNMLEETCLFFPARSQFNRIHRIIALVGPGLHVGGSGRNRSSQSLPIDKDARLVLVGCLQVLRKIRPGEV